MDDTLAQESAVTSLRQVANESAQIPTHTKLIHESGHDAARQWIGHGTWTFAVELRWRIRAGRRNAIGTGCRRGLRYRFGS